MARPAKIQLNEGALGKVVREMTEAANRIAAEVAATAEGKTEDQLVAEMKAKGRTTFAKGAGPDDQAWRSMARKIIAQDG